MSAAMNSTLTRPASFRGADSALRMAASEGTVVLAVIALGLALGYGVFRLAWWAREWYVRMTVSELRARYVSRLAALAEAERQRAAQRAAEFHNPIYDDPPRRTTKKGAMHVSYPSRPRASTDATDAP